jgi:MFS family permease
MGWYGTTSSLGLAVGPYMGVELVRAWGFRATFLLAAGVAAQGAGEAGRLPETRPAAADPGAAASRPGLLSPARWFSRRALYPAALLLALFFPYGGVVGLLPLFAARAGLGNPGLFFAAFAVAVVLVRPRAGYLADRLGRAAVVAPALAAAGLALAVLALTRSPGGLVAAAVVFGVGFGAAQPALMAMAGDRVPAAERGRAMGTLYTAWELGISSGSVVLGLTADRLGYGAMWWAAAAAAWLGALAAWPAALRERAARAGPPPGRPGRA